ncbi:hypothetical protein RB195_000456 [Necator americanus]|uniref:C2H2-type domain-containing protein n=1 Tax=Necator americanus TaxID=51031 RepID=A0ABR1D9U2_NECAM
MPVWCQLCDIYFEESLELEVHYLSLSHHIKLETTNPVIHCCPACAVSCSTLSEYSKHIDTEEHRKKRDRMRAIIDTMDAGDDRRRCNAVPDRIQQPALTPNYMQPSSSFVRNGNKRRTYPAPNINDGQQPRFGRALARHPSQLQGQDSFATRCSSQQGPNSVRPIDSECHDSAWRNTHYSNPPRPYVPSLPEETSSHSESCTNKNVASGVNYEDSRVHFSTDVRRFDGYGREKGDNPQLLTGSDAQQDFNSVKHSSPPKRGILARLSLRRKDKASKGNVGDKTEKPERGDRKGKKKKSLTRSPPSLVSLKTQATNDMGESSRNRIRTAFVNVAMKDKTKKWELVAVKGKASYLKNRSQRMLKDRMSKYRLVDSKGVVVQEMTGEEQNTSHFRRVPTGGRNGSNLPHLSSHIWGTGPEALPRSQQRDTHFKTPGTSSALSGSAPPPPQSPSSLLCRDDSNSGYAIMHDFPMSTPKNYSIAARAYENCQGSPVPDITSNRNGKRAPDAPFISSSNTATVSEADFDLSNSFSVNSSLVLDCRSLTSRMNLISTANVTRCSEAITVKDEPGECPPPEALPSPPQFDQTVSLQGYSGEAKIGGEKEREEFWELGIAEHKKGHEILETRGKIERIQAELFEATAYLQKLEVEMNDILRRKSELLGLPPPSSVE